MENKITIPEYFNSQFCDAASYDNYRKIASFVDGQKNSSRKILYTIMQKKIKDPIKVSQLCSKVAEFTEYLHGEASLGGIIVNLAQDFINTNNLPLLKRKGNFGTRFLNDPAASRYIFTCQEDYFSKIFTPEDTNILISQEFEGNQIEPKFLLPIVPLILINGSEAISTGFAQKVLPRNPIDIINHIIKRLQGHPGASQSSSIKLTPWFNGWKGDVVNEDGSWVFAGKMNTINSTTFEITEIPPNYDLASYLKVLDKLEDTGVIQSYEDNSDNGQFNFVIKMTKKNAEKFRKKQGLLATFKLVRRVSENFTMMDENNKITVDFKDANDILEKFISFRLEYYQKRKEYLIDKLTTTLREKVSKFTFLKYVIENGIDSIHKLSDEELEKLLSTIKNIIKINDSFDYLLNIPIRSISKTNFDKLKMEIMEHKKDLDNLQGTTPENIWIKDLEDLKKTIKGN